ncbi:hypothetical protein GCM10011579_030900 [Streptomyces albiflavescens]|uniref:Uncharacterized protein n=1 Tax=Streptomyces albiflavescens TaxID=1623582 RepID=A0A917Y283_9ACTN|nr:hypothetical protein [Streptomyces albiflavescens]GGN63051.1 hypothetical protein GCM10011579_030900 [Streptomyces albiflavescens]
MVVADPKATARPDDAQHQAAKHSEFQGSRVGEFVVGMLLGVLFAALSVGLPREARRVQGIRLPGIRTAGLVVGIWETTDGDDDDDAQPYPQVRYTLPAVGKVVGESGSHAIRCPLCEGEGVELLNRPELLGLLYSRAVPHDARPN